MFVEQLPVPVETDLRDLIEKDVILKNEEQIDYLVYTLYGLSEEEIHHIDSKEE